MEKYLKNFSTLWDRVTESLRKPGIKRNFLNLIRIIRIKTTHAHTHARSHAHALTHACSHTLACTLTHRDSHTHTRRHMRTVTQLILDSGESLNPSPRITARRHTLTAIIQAGAYF